MYELTDPKIIKYLCQKYGFSFAKSMGQNFITDANVPLTMAKTATDGAEGIIEIGPGFGTLTAPLALNAKKVISIELDKRLQNVLEETLGGFQNVSFIWEDCLKVNLGELIKNEFDGMNVSVAANLPYYITTPIIMNLLESGLPFKKIVVMIQKEVAQRLCAAPATKDYGAISVATQYYSKPQIIMNVPSSSFIPAPKVDSAVVCMDILEKPSVSPKDEKLFFKLIKAAFAQRRKTLVNALSGSGAFGTKEEIAKAVEMQGFSPTVRGEALSIEDFCTLSDYFTENGGSF
ncbi:MAG: 16S rRNA (adenine(1518)-N(6)/adenine(1519)-N(6))-dimethyltransferase RsmA [Clostridia bacterium]|nr:16S rRNA (adenine(1518)-N(6)/adenine(1519)-N(6))-dimethyltransferase RsmA [Clostridia bacterium]